MHWMSTKVNQDVGLDFKNKLLERNGNLPKFTYQVSLPAVNQFDDS